MFTRYVPIHDTLSLKYNDLLTQFTLIVEVDVVEIEGAKITNEHIIWLYISKVESFIEWQLHSLLHFTFTTPINLIF
jgi:hypothetical protein